MRKKSFNKAVIKPITINDSRFGVRRIFINKQERPRVATYRTPSQSDSKGLRGSS